MHGSVAEISGDPSDEIAAFKRDVSQREIEVGQHQPAAMVRALIRSNRENKWEIT
jgi:hypothetical protein